MVEYFPLSVLLSTRDFMGATQVHGLQGFALQVARRGDVKQTCFTSPQRDTGCKLCTGLGPINTCLQV